MLRIERVNQYPFTLDVVELQGGVDVYEVRVTSETFSNIYTYGSEIDRAIIDGLQPNTRYEVRVTIVVHGGETISSDSAYVTTLDGGNVEFALLFLEIYFSCCAIVPCETFWCS